MSFAATELGDQIEDRRGLGVLTGEPTYRLAGDAQQGLGPVGAGEELLYASAALWSRTLSMGTANSAASRAYRYADPRVGR